MSEFVSINLEIDLSKAETVVAGVDVGAVTSQAVILADGQPYAFSQVKTRIPKESALRAINIALFKGDLELEKIQYIVGTGCGRKQVPYAHNTISEISCAAAGAVHIWGPSVRTVLDIGGQSCRIVNCTQTGRVASYLLSDKCASGIGRSMELFADLVQKEISEIGSIAAGSDKTQRFSDFCAIYARSEAIDLIRDGVPLEEIITGYHHAMAKRISTLAAREGVQKDLVIIGGLAKNPAIVNSLENTLGLTRLSPKPEWDPALVVALGAALFADKTCHQNN